MGLFNRGGIFKFHDSGEDDGIREYDDEGYLVCNRCGTRMHFWYDEDSGVDYAECPSCGFIEIESYDDESNPDDTEYDDYYPNNDDDDE